MFKDPVIESDSLFVKTSFHADGKTAQLQKAQAKQFLHLPSLAL
jgi:hypothetical protein